MPAIPAMQKVCDNTLKFDDFDGQSLPLSATSFGNKSATGLQQFHQGPTQCHKPSLDARQMRSACPSRIRMEGLQRDVQRTTDCNMFSHEFL